MMGNMHLRPSHCRVISIPSILKFRELVLSRQMSGRVERPQATIATGSPCVTPFMTVKKVTSAIVVMDHKCTSVIVGIETKLGARGPLMSNNPQHGCPIELIKGIMGINEQKPPVFRSMVDIPGMLHEMNGTFNTSRKASTELVSTTCFSGTSECAIM